VRAVVGAATAAGLLHYQTDPDTGRIVGVSTTDAATTLAGQVVSAYQTVAAALATLPDDWLSTPFPPRRSGCPPIPCW